MGRLQVNSNLSKDNKISVKKQNTGGGKLIFNQNYILNSRFDTDNQYPIYDGSSFYDANYNIGGPIYSDPSYTKILTNYYHNSPLFYIPGPDYHTFANRTFHKINSPYDILPIGHPIQPRLMKLFGVGSVLEKPLDNHTSYQRTITSDNISTPTAINSWLKYGVEQMIAIPSNAKKIVYGVRYLVKSDDNFRLNNFGGLVLYFQKDNARSYVNFNFINNDYTSGPVSDYSNLFIGYDIYTNLYRYFSAASNATSQWVGPSTTTVKVRKRNTISLAPQLGGHPEYLDNFQILQDTISIPTFSTIIGNPDATNGFPDYVSLQMFFAEWENYLNEDEISSGSIYFYQPFLYFEY
jgi:hypothetical protein